MQPPNPYQQQLPQTSTDVTRNGTGKKWLFIPLLLSLLLLSACGQSLSLPTFTSASHQPWTATVGSLAKSLVVANGILYVDSFDNIYALDAASGQQKWAVPIYSPLYGHLAIANGVVYARGYKNLAAFDAATGQKKWSISSSLSMGNNPIVVNGTIYCGGDKLYAFDAATGQQKWTSPTNGVGELAVANGVVYGSINGKLTAFDAVSGKQKWINNSSIGSYLYLVVADGMLYAIHNNESIGDDKLYTFDAAGGQQKWVASVGTPGHIGAGIPVIVNNVVYIDDDKLYAFDATSGQQKWASPAHGQTSSATAANGVVYVGNYSRHELYAFDAVTGQQKDSINLDGNSSTNFGFSPVIANDMVYVFNNDEASRESKVSAFAL